MEKNLAKMVKQNHKMLLDIEDALATGTTLLDIKTQDKLLADVHKYSKSKSHTANVPISVLNSISGRLTSILNMGTTLGYDKNRIQTVRNSINAYIKNHTED